MSLSVSPLDMGACLSLSPAEREELEELRSIHRHRQATIARAAHFGLPTPPSYHSHAMSDATLEPQSPMRPAPTFLTLSPTPSRCPAPASSRTPTPCPSRPHSTASWHTVTTAQSRPPSPDATRRVSRRARSSSITRVERRAPSADRRSKATATRTRSTKDKSWMRVRR